MRGLLILTVLLVLGCGSQAEIMDPTPVVSAPPSVDLDGNRQLDIDTAGPTVVDIPPVLPPELVEDEAVEISIPPKMPCTIEAQVQNRTLGFAFNSAEISPHGQERIRSWVTAIVDANRNDHRDLIRVEVRAHSSTDGDADHNLGLSMRRAASVRRVLLALPGLDGVPVDAEGQGETDPQVWPEVTEADRMANRRAEIFFHYTGCAEHVDPSGGG
jgi:peptidoglycan-binding protein ArfA